MAFVQVSPDKTILFFGDSLTAGYGLTEEEAFPALVEKSLNQKGKKVNRQQMMAELQKGMKDWGKEGAQRMWISQL